MNDTCQSSSVQALEEEYVLNKKASWEIVGKPKLKFIRRPSKLNDVEKKVMELLQVVILN